METDTELQIHTDSHQFAGGDNDEAQEYGNEIEDIISSKPPAIVRYGTVYFLIILLALASACWFIQYPDIITASAKLTSINSPKDVKAKTEGQLVKLIAAEGKYVQKNQLLGFIESRANANEVLMLAAITDSMQAALQHDNTQLAVKYFDSFNAISGASLSSGEGVGDRLPDEIGPNALGEMQLPYQTFVQGFILFKQYLTSGYYLQKRNMLHGDMTYLQKQHGNLLLQRNLNTEDLALSQKTFNANQSLNNDKVISDFDYRNENSKLIGKKLSLPQVNASILSNESAQHEKQKEIMQLENEIAQQKSIFSQSLNTLKAQLNEWKSKYVITAPVAGKIVFASFIQENQQMQAGQTICFVNPENTEYYAEILVPQSNFGKIAQGEEVLLKFPSYPFQEYGNVRGKIDFISHIGTDSGYLTKVILPAGLKTNYGKAVQYRDGLQAQAEIITKEMRLLQRFYYSIVKQVK